MLGPDRPTAGGLISSLHPPGLPAAALPTLPGDVFSTPRERSRPWPSASRAPDRAAPDPSSGGQRSDLRPGSGAVLPDPTRPRSAPSVADRRGRHASRTQRAAEPEHPGDARPCLPTRRPHGGQPIQHGSPDVQQHGCAIGRTAAELVDTHLHVGEVEAHDAKPVSEQILGAAAQEWTIHGGTRTVREDNDRSAVQCTLPKPARRSARDTQRAT